MTVETAGSLSSAAPVETPADTSARSDSATRWLAAGVLAGVAGMSAAALRGGTSAINTFLFMDLGLSHGSAVRMEHTALLVVLAMSVAGVVLRRWAFFLPAFAMILGEAVSRTHVQGQAFSDWALATNAARFGSPLALMLVLAGLERSGAAVGQWLLKVAPWTLRLALAATFAAHGAEALNANAVFIDLIISTASAITGVRVTESEARAALQVIGYLDLGVAVLVLLYAPRAALIWAGCWAAIAALARVTASGWGAYPDVLVRASYFLAPVALWLLVRRTRHAGPPAEQSPLSPNR